MAKAKGSAITFAEFPDVKLTWDTLHGRFSVKKERVSQPVGFLAPQNWKWQIQTPNLSPVGDMIASLTDALRAAAEHFSSCKSTTETKP